ncbi:MAG: CehA/McbA family metallohydrolase [Deltaproteobacteria bacterium]|nr:CehA/McbA family metallohydrolase [Deltaproteobacteria bacterium]
MRRILPLGLAALLACTDDTETKAPAPPLDVVLGASEARAGVITKPTELLSGDTAKGRVGDFKLYNQKVAFVIGRLGDGRGYAPFGGDVIDADRVRAPGEPGHSTFGEIITAIDLATQRPTSVEVVADGTAGGAAIVRVTGEEDSLPLFEVLFSSLFGNQKHELIWTTDYVLEPGAEALKIEHTLENTGSETVEIGLVINAYLFGDGAEPFLPFYGYHPPSTGAVVEYFGAIASEVSYLTGDLGEKLSFIASVGGGISVAGSRGPLRIRPIERVGFTQVLVVGGGDLAATQSIWRKMDGSESEAVAVKGRVTASGGAAAPGARVHATLVTPRREDADYVSQTVVQPDGSYSFELPMGEYDLRASAPSYPPTATKRVTVGASVPAPIDFSISAPGIVEYSITDGDSVDIPAKITVLANGVETLPARFGVPGQPGGVLFTEYAITGRGQFALPEGHYEVYVSRGLEYEAHHAELDVRPGTPARLDAKLVRSVDTPGWLATDTHIHSQLSPDSPDLFPFKVKTMVVEGLELPISTEHEAIGDFNPSIEQLGLSRYMKGIVGSEVTTTSYGHFNAWPLVANPELPGNGRIDWYFKKPAETFATIRAQGLDPVVQVNHPRAASIGGYFSAMGFDASTLTPRRTDQWSDDFDVIEVANGCGVGSIERETMPDWFAFLDAGMKKFAAGSTDSHHAAYGEMGSPRTYVRLGTDDPRAVTPEAFRDVTRAGRMVVTCGPYLQIERGTAGPGDVSKLEGDLVSVSVRVQAPSWMDVDSVELVTNGGRVVKRVSVPQSLEPIRFSGTLTASVTPGKDGWVIARARGDRPHPIFARGRPSYAFTNPILLDGNGDGRFGR